jgi:hypothetical protein
MPEYARVVTFEADDSALDALLSSINAEDAVPEGVPASRIIVLSDRAAGKVVVSTRFASMEDLEKGSATLESMSPPADAGSIKRVSVEVFEVVLERSAS